MKPLFILLFAIGIMLSFNCKKDDLQNIGNHQADVGNAWMQMHIRLTKTTAGYNSVVSLRSFGYAGITLYESLLPATEGRGSLFSKIGGTPVIADKSPDEYYWPAAANAAMATMTRMLFESTSDVNKLAIDSLEEAYYTKPQDEADAQKIQNAIDYGRKVATAIFDWSKTDGSHEAYKHIVDPAYVPPAGPGLWIPTPPAFGPPVHPHRGTDRSFMPNSAELTQPGPPLAYSESTKSPFFKMAAEVYTISLSLSSEDSIIVKFWGEIPANMNVPAHATNIVTQLIETKKMDLFDAAAVYALHGIALNDAGISVLKTKYKYNLVRPVSYICKVMQKPAWTTVIPTPPHPEYSAAHAVVSAASATVLACIFGENYKFSDQTYQDSYGTRSFNSFEDYAKEAGRSRLLGGIHYAPSIAVGLVQGEQIGKMVNKLKSDVSINIEE